MSERSTMDMDTLLAINKERLETIKKRDEIIEKREKIIEKQDQKIRKYERYVLPKNVIENKKVRKWGNYLKAKIRKFILIY